MALFDGKRNKVAHSLNPFLETCIDMYVLLG